MKRYKTINLRFKEEEWTEFEKIVELYRDKVSQRLSVHLIAKSLLEQGRQSVLEQEI